jgi:hypothetical protein
MNYFVNYKNGKCSIDTYRLADAAVTDMSDLICSFMQESGESLTVSLDIYLDESAKAVIEKLEKSGFDSYEDFKDYILQDENFLDDICNRLNIDHTFDPSIRAYQLELFDAYSLSKYERPAY